MTVEMSYVVFDSYSLHIVSDFRMAQVTKDVVTHIYHIAIRITPFTVSVICIKSQRDGLVALY